MTTTSAFGVKRMVGYALFTAVIGVMVSAASASPLTPVTWNIDSGASLAKLAIQDFTVAGLNFPIGIRNQSSGSWNQGNQANLGGTLQTLFDVSNESAIQLLPNQPDVYGINSGSYAPNPADYNTGTFTYDANSTAPAVFGGRGLAFVFPLFSMSITDVAFDLSSAAALPISAGTIGSLNSTGTTFGIADSRFNLIGIPVSTGSAPAYVVGGPWWDVSDLPMSGLSTLGGPGSSAAGTVTAGAFPGGNNRKLTLNLTMRVAINPPQYYDAGYYGDTVLSNLVDNQNYDEVVFQTTISSTLVAYAFVPEPSSGALASLAAASLGLAALRARRRLRR